MLKKMSSSSSSSPISQFSNSLGGRLLQQLIQQQQPGENVLLSPASVSVALSMTLAGAGGETRREMLSTLALGEAKEPHSMAGGLARLLAAGRPGLQLSLANRIFADRSFSLLQPFAKLLGDSYAAEVGSVDFRSDADTARKQINSWVEEQTATKIRDLLGSGAVDANTRLVLVNAIYFKGTWQKTFNKEETYQGDFELEPSKPAKVNYMTQTTQLQFAESDALRVVLMPFVGEKCDAVFVLPTERHRLSDKLGSAGGLDGVVKLVDEARQQDPMDVELHLPRFKIECQASLEEENLLPQLGMRRLFQRGAADLSGINDKEELFVSKVVHKACLEINEEGAEAAAATGVAVACFAMPMNILFMASEPFLMLISDRETGAVLFASRVAQPKE